MKISSSKPDHNYNLELFETSLSPAVLAEMLRSTLQTGSAVKLTIISGSMLPFLRVGDEIEVTKCDPLQLQNGEIILFEGQDALYTHRIWKMAMERGKMYLLTRGDALRYFDPPISAESIIGRVVARHRIGSTSLYFFRNGWGKWSYDRVKQVTHRESASMPQHKQLSLLQKGRRWSASKVYNALRWLIIQIGEWFLDHHRSVV